MDDRAILAAAIAKSGYSAREFAGRIVTRNERVVRRWMEGETPIPSEVTRFLRSYLAGEVTVTWTTPSS